MARDFNDWFDRFRDSIADYKYYVDFDKVYAHIDTMKVELNILNSLVGSQTIEDDFIAIATRYPEILRCIPILVAKREREIRITDMSGYHTFNFAEGNITVADSVLFMRESGLFHLIQNRIVSNMVDYVTGVEVGMDTHGRKLRGGHLMENLVEHYILQAGYVRDDTYFKEMESVKVATRWGVDLSALTNAGKTTKRFDFVIKTPTMIYAIETNFYAVHGSKLNETARSYKTLAIESREITGFTFIWVTDGIGWSRAKNNLEETFEVLPTLYNIDDLEHGILRTLR